MLSIQVMQDTANFVPAPLHLAVTCQIKRHGHVLNFTFIGAKSCRKTVKIWNFAIHIHPVPNFVRMAQLICPLGENLYKQFQILTILETVSPYFYTDNQLNFASGSGEFDQSGKIGNRPMDTPLGKNIEKVPNFDVFGLQSDTLAPTKLKFGNGESRMVLREKAFDCNVLPRDGRFGYFANRLTGNTNRLITS